MGRDNACGKRIEKHKSHRECGLKSPLATIQNGASLGPEAETKTQKGRQCVTESPSVMFT